MPHLPIAIRAYTEQAKKRKARRKGPQVREAGWPSHAVVFDTETTTDEIQRLIFGSYGFYRWSQDGTRLECLEEGFFYDDELPKIDPEGFARLQEYAKTRRAEVIPDVPGEIQLLSRTEFAEEVLYGLAYQTRALVVGFNLPFDLSRLAVDCGKARGRFRGGFSFVLWGRREGRKKRWRANPYRPRIDVKHVDSKRSFIEFTRPAKIDPEDQRPAEGAPPDPRYYFRGHFLDLKTLAFALTDQAYTLESACKAFEVEHPKTKASEHGVITPEYIDYNRDDVRASKELLEKLREEFDRHPIDLDPCQAYSPASIAKAYLREMGLRSPAEQSRNIPQEMTGYAMSAFYGGRAECRIRKTPVPVIHTDFTSMYPTVQSLMGLWRLIRAERVEVVDATEDVRKLLAEVSIEACFQPETWGELVCFAQVVPEGDVLPVRAKYLGDELTVGVNRVTGEVSLWYAIPDLVASTLLAGKPPRILRAFRLVPKGRQPQLKPIRLRGGVEVDPRKENLFRAVIEARQRVKHNRKLKPGERDRTERFLKVFANAGSYGIFVEMNRKPTPKDKPVKLAVYGRKGSFTCRTNAPEDPGPFCFPPVGAIIPAAARLMLALLERCVTDAGGSYAFADTDSMAIVASKKGGLIPCPGGPHRLPDGGPAVRALSWPEVDSVVSRFEALNPYDKKAVPGSILRIEDVNFEPTGGGRRELWAYVISAKRYALFTMDADGRPEIPEDGYSEHGLGHLLNPIDPELEDREWIRETWEGIVREALGGPRFEPPWSEVPAMMKSGVSTPILLDRFSELNRGRTYENRVKPFNFLLSASVNPIDYPPNLAKTGVHLIAPYSRNPSDWLRVWWTDVHSGGRYRIRTNGPSNRSAIRVQTFADVLDRFRTHPEAKSSGPEGNTSNYWTSGLLGRLDVQVLTVSHIGKETNLLEQQEEGVLIEDPQEVYTGGGEWEAIRPYLDRVSISELAKGSGVSERMLRNLRKGDRRPSRKTLKAITEALVQMLDKPEG